MFGDNWDDHLPPVPAQPVPVDANYNEPVRFVGPMGKDFMTSLAAHDYQEMPGRNVQGENPHENVMILRCKWCMNTPTKARQDGCHVRELAETGSMMLRVYNPDGIGRFAGRPCVTCNEPIMSHWLRSGSNSYWCKREGGTASEGIADGTWDVPEEMGKI